MTHKLFSVRMFNKKYILIVALLICGCSLTAFFFSDKNLNKEDINAYISEPSNGLIKSKKIGAVSIEVLFKPSDLLIHQDWKSIQVSSDKEGLIKNYNAHYYFILSISNGGQELESDMAKKNESMDQAIDELSFGMGQYITIVNDKNDTISIEDYAYPRTYGGSTRSSFILAFRNEKLKNAETFKVCIDYPYLMVGKQEFEFEINNIQAVPSLKMDDLK
jgi:hypothetical protein